MKMHSNEVDINIPLIQRLIATQFPIYADLPIVAVLSSGTDNALYRLGEKLVVRLPRIADKERHIEKEYTWLPKLAPHLPLAIPTPVALGKSQGEYPFEWAIYGWLEGATFSDEPPANLNQVANELAGFILELQKIATDGAPQPNSDFDRGVPLIRRDQHTRKAILALKDNYEIQKLNSVWKAALNTEPWNKVAVWIHGDLDGRNMLVKDNRLTAVIDFGSLGVGDPAYDVMVAWKIFSNDSRKIFKEKLQVDDATWTRGRGLVLSQAVMILSYYTEQTNPVLLKEAQSWMGELGF